MSADEEKTKVLPRKPAAAEPATTDGGTIVFRCPNGHRIVASVTQAGKRGACSKCRIPVTIPAPDDAQAAGGDAAATSPRPPAAPEPEGSPAVAGPSVETPVVADETSGLSLQVPEPPAAGEEENWNFIGETALEPAAGGPEATWPAGPAGDGGSPVALLVARLWAEREHGGIIELHLDGGSVIMPEWYDINWSRGTHGLFASQAADGSVTLTAVAWETVRKVVVRQLTEVPDDMFT